MKTRYCKSGDNNICNGRCYLCKYKCNIELFTTKLVKVDMYLIDFTSENIVYSKSKLEQILYLDILKNGCGYEHTSM